MKHAAAQGTISYCWYGTRKWKYVIKKLAARSPRDYKLDRPAVAKALGVPVKVLDVEVRRLRRRRRGA